MSKKPRTAAEYIWSSLKLKSTDSASIEGKWKVDIAYYVSQSGYAEFQDSVTKALEAFDKTSKGVISFKDFQDVSGNAFDPFASEDTLRAIFSVFDKNGEGYLYDKDILALANEMKVNLTAEEAARIVQAMDSDQDGAIDFKEFKAVVKT